MILKIPYWIGFLVSKKIFLYGITLLLLTVLVCIRLYPLPVGIDQYVPSDYLDPLLLVWIFGWNFHCFSQGMSGYLTANIFYPFPNTLLLSETMLIPSLLLYPFYYFGFNLVACFNLFFLVSMIVSGFSVFLLCYEITNEYFPSLVSGIIYCISTWSCLLWRRPHLLLSGYLFLCLLSLYFYFKYHKIRYLFSYSLLILLLLTSNSYFSLAIIFCSLLLIIIQFSRKFSLKELISLSLTALILAFFYGIHGYLYKTAIIHNRFLGTPPTETLQIITNTLSNYVWPSDLNRFYTSWFPLTFQTYPEMRFFPGFSTIGLSILGFYALFHANRNQFDPPKSRFDRHLELDLILLGILTLLSNTYYAMRGYDLLHISAFTVPHICHFLLLVFIPVLICLHKPMFLQLKRILQTGHPLLVLFLSTALVFLYLSSYYPSLFIFTTLPWTFFIRMPGRYGLFVFLFISILAGLGIRYLFHLYNRWIYQGSILLLFLIVLFYETSVPHNYISIDTQMGPSAIYRWLGKQDSIQRIIEIPMNDPTQNIGYQYYSTFHWKKLLNGYSGYFPFEYKTLMDAMKNFPSRQSLLELKNRACDLVIVHKKIMDESQYNSIQILSKILPGFIVDYEDGDTLAISIDYEKIQAVDVHFRFVGNNIHNELSLVLKKDAVSIPLIQRTSETEYMEYLPLGEYTLFDLNQKQELLHFILDNSTKESIEIPVPISQ